VGWELARGIGLLDSRWKRIDEGISREDEGAERDEEKRRAREKEKERTDKEEEEEKDEENSLDNPKHPIRTMLSNRTIIESRSSRIFIVNSRESSGSVYFLSAPSISK
jgi:hypothetical protein